jgi:hypothetical protein
MLRLRGLLPFGVFAVVALSSVACHHVHVDDVRGADGQDWKRVSCSRVDKRCFKVAAAMCPDGYYFARASGSIAIPIAAPEASDDEGGDEPSPPRAGAPSPRAPLNAQTLPPQERWGSGMYSRHRGAILVRCAMAGHEQT